MFGNFYICNLFFNLKTLMENKQKVAFYTLGCKLNFSETSTISRLFNSEIYDSVSFDSQADIVVINTCTVTATADKKCRQIIRKAIKTSPYGIIVVIGCYAQLKPNQIAKIEGVDIILGTNEKLNIIEYLQKYEKQQSANIHSCETNEISEIFPAYSIADRTRSFLKIQDGCNYECSYCTIPMARGKSRNVSIDKIIEQVRNIAMADVKEIVLTGVNIGDFGYSSNETFLELIKKLDDISGIERYRISSIEPNLLTDEIIEFVGKSKKFVPHFHIPLQSGSDSILKLMSRRYNTQLFSKRVEKINNTIENVCIGVDVIVGFPSEEEAEFLETFNYLRDLNISYLLVFSYSERENTKSVDLPGKVSKADIQRRSKALHNLSATKKLNFYNKNLGTKKLVLFENHTLNKKLFGFTENYVKLEIDFDEKYKNQLINFELQNINKNGNVEGKIIEN